MQFDEKEYDWINNGNIIQYRFSQFGKQLFDEERYKEFIDIYERFSDIEFNKFCKHWYTWSLYKAMRVDADNDISTDEIILEKIIDNCNQYPTLKEHYTPFVLSIRYFVKKIKNSNNINYEKIYYWLTKLNPDILSENEMEFKSKEGKDYTNVSSKEFYYTMLIKSLVKLERFEICISVSEFALRSISRWNYKNDLWIKSRQLLSKCMISTDFDKDIRTYLDFVTKENKWFLYHKISNIYFRNAKFPESIIYASKGFITGTKRDRDMMVNLIYDLALLLVNQSEEVATKLLQLCYQIRLKNGWNIKDALKYYVKLYDISRSSKIDFEKLQDSVIYFTGMNEGKIKMFNDSFGFIRGSNQKDYYFRVNKKLYGSLSLRKKVFFDIVYNEKKGKNEARNLHFAKEN
ncbi:MAG: hypothetical protein K8Q99_06675 [Acholeplasmataceae bacterium]|nr:hypothetical protein [Acholeplasmataceae bacterium]